MPKILIVDDDNHLRETLRDILEMERFQVSEAASGQEAIRQVMTGFFEVILMDFNLADQTGIEVIREIRKVNKDSEILMMTAHASLDTAVKAIQESVYDFLIKPVDYNYLKKAIGNALEKFRLREENRRLIEQLRRNNEQLVSLNNMKSKFLSMASHDLSNALMTLQVSFDMMAPQLTGLDAESKKRLRYIADSLGQISRLVEDLVDWASIERGKFRLERAVFLPGEMVETVLTGLRQRAANKGIRLEAAALADLPPVHADRRRLGQVLNNLLENALRHTPRGGRIEVSAAGQGKEVRFSVADNGDGIEREDLDRIFESFFQGSGNRAGGRLGLGLSIAREIVTSHGGALTAESAGRGKGAAFHFTIPRAEG